MDLDIETMLTKLRKQLRHDAFYLSDMVEHKEMNEFSLDVIINYANHIAENGRRIKTLLRSSNTLEIN